MHIAIVDVESTLRDGTSSPHHKDNSAVHIGVAHTFDGEVRRMVLHKRVQRQPTESIDPELETAELLVGHNIKFDLTSLHNTDSIMFNLRNIVNSNTRIWDTQLAEYLLTGQEAKWSSLDQLSNKYGGTIKDSKLKEYWSAGISSEDIPEGEIIPYLKEDVLNTELIFKQQVKAAKDKGMLPLIWTQMDALLATTMMELNGIHVSAKKLGELAVSTKEFIVHLDCAINIALENILPSPVAIEQFNINSNKQLATLIYGGKLSYTYMADTGELYKSGIKKGTPKFKKTLVEYEIPSSTLAAPSFSGVGNIMCDASTLKEVLPTVTNKSVAQIIENILEKKLLDKQLNTYYEPLLTQKDEHDIIHHQLNHCATVTGRLSSSNPNFQNIPRGSTAPVKTCITSRYEDGVIVEADYSQLEVIALAHITGDHQLITDMLAGVDMHTVNAAKLFNVKEEAVTKEQRTKAKVGTFQLQYGAGAETIANKAGLSLEQARALIKNYYDRYPGIRRYHEHVKKTLEAARIPTGKRTALGIPAGQATYVSETGRRYVFKEYDAPEWLAGGGTKVTFSPTEMKNYMIQGLATADIVPLMLGKVLRNVMPAYYTSNSAVMCNTVHDSMIFDVQRKHLQFFLVDLQNELNNVHKYLDEIFGIKFNLPLKVEIEYGPSWGELTKWTGA